MQRLSSLYIVEICLFKLTCSVVFVLQCLESVYSSERVSEEVVVRVDEILRTNPVVQEMFLQVSNAPWCVFFVDVCVSVLPS